jgi:hypothetical protein
MYVHRNFPAHCMCCPTGNCSELSNWSILMSRCPYEAQHFYNIVPRPPGGWASNRAGAWTGHVGPVHRAPDKVNILSPFYNTWAVVFFNVEKMFLSTVFECIGAKGYLMLLVRFYSITDPSRKNHYHSLHWTHLFSILQFLKNSPTKNWPIWALTLTDVPLFLFCYDDLCISRLEDVETTALRHGKKIIAKLEERLRFLESDLCKSPNLSG